jgi:hypothetical protein
MNKPKHSIAISLPVISRFYFLKCIFIGFCFFSGATNYSALAQPTITIALPSANSNTAARNSAVTVGFSQLLNAGSATGLRVFSNQRGGLRTGNSGTTAISGNTVSFVPTYDFRPGETVKVSVTTAAQTSGGVLAVPKVFQFTAAVTGGSGIFTRTNVPAGASPYNVTMADVDNDGDLDMLSAWTKLNEVFGYHAHLTSACRSISTASLNGPNEAVEMLRQAQHDGLIIELI